MSAQRMALGEADPMMGTPSETCSAASPVQDWMSRPFICTRRPGHGTDVEHVACGVPTGSTALEAVALGAWLEGGPLRVLGIDVPLPAHLAARYEGRS